jgi:hypothetical protein
MGNRRARGARLTNSKGYTDLCFPLKDTDLFWIPCTETIAILLKALILLKGWI